MLEPVQPSPISTRYVRARTRKLEAVVAAMAEAGVAAVWAGAEFQLTGLDRLTTPDRELLDRLRPEIERHLAEPGSDDPEALLELLGIEIEVVDDPAQAQRVIAALPGSVALDIETEPRESSPPPALRLTKTGRRYVDQPPADTTGASLCPFRGKPRLLQVFDPNRGTVFVFDMHALTYADLIGLFDRRVLTHSMFELVMLGAQGVELPDVIDTLQLASLVVGHAVGVRKLSNIAAAILGLELPKTLQTSYWAARNLSDAQLAYAAADATTTYRAGRRMYQQLGERERQAFWLANAAILPIARMQLRGLPFNRAAHEQWIADRQADYANARREFHELTRTEVPARAPATRAWLEVTLPAEALATWKRTPSGLLSTEAAELKKAGLDHPEVRPLLALREAEKRIATFGQPLLDAISATTGRVHGDFFLPLASGRTSCRSPNLQQLPVDVRAAVEAAPGKILLDADYGQIELRIVAELASEEVMRSVFAAGQDIHKLTAATILGVSVDEVTPAQRDMAKPANFGLIYGMGAKTLREYAWSDYGLDWTLEQAAAIRSAFFELYPAIRFWQRARGRDAEQLGEVWSIAGRPRRAAWEPNGELWYTVALNHCVQGSGADVLLDAMARVDRELPGTLILSLHDELLLEVAADQAEQAAKVVLAEQMTAAFSKWFPHASTVKLIEVKQISTWSEAK
jgi:DNA polymerase-1